MSLRALRLITTPQLTSAAPARIRPFQSTGGSVTTSLPFAAPPRPFFISVDVGPSRSCLTFLGGTDQDRQKQIYDSWTSQVFEVLPLPIPLH